MTDERPIHGPFVPGPTVDALLCSEAAWLEPPDELEDRVVAAIAAAARPDHSRYRRERPRRSGPGLVRLAAAAAVMLVVAVGVLTVGGRDTPSGVAVALGGTELAQSATASAMVDSTPRGTKIVLDVDGLAAADPGTYYQAWIVKDDITVSAGSFHLRGGAGAIELWCGMDITTDASIVVTLQDDGGSAEPSDRVVLVGLIPG